MQVCQCWSLVFHIHPCFFTKCWEALGGMLRYFSSSSCVSLPPPVFLPPSRGGLVHVQREDLMPVHPPSIFVLNGHRAHWTPLISGLCGWMMEKVLAYFGERKGMCAGKQELELLGKHEQGCSHGSHLLPATAALQCSFPFIQVPFGLLGESTATKSCWNCPKAQRAAVMPSRSPPESWGTHNEPHECSGDMLPMGITAGAWGLLWGMRQMGICSFWDHFWGIATSPSLRRNAAGSVISPLMPILWEVGMMLDPSGMSPFSSFLPLLLPFVPLDFESQSTLLCE